MGAYAALFWKNGASVPDGKKEEFKKRIEKLFQAGGMMELKRKQLCGEDIVTMKKASMHDYGMNFYYNYFEDAGWENAGYDPETGSVWSNKIGGQQFSDTVIAAYVLESLYMDGTAAVLADGEIADEYEYTGWINHLFGEHFLPKNNDPWKLFEAMHENFGEEAGSYQWIGFAQSPPGIMGYYEILAVLKGTDTADAWICSLTEGEQDDDKRCFYDFSRKLKKAVTEYHEKSLRSSGEQVSFIMEVLRAVYTKGQNPLDTVRKTGEKGLEPVLYTALLSGVPAYAVKAVSEVYGNDFWGLWEKVCDAAGRGLYQDRFGDLEQAGDVTASDFLHISPDDMVLFWEPDGEIRFSSDMNQWLDRLKRRFSEILEDGFSEENPLQWITGLIKYADENYYRIYTFDDFLEETKRNLDDARFLALWKLYDELLHDPEMEEAGNAVFVPDGPEYARTGLYYLGTPPRRRLTKNWNDMRKEEKFNRARVTFRRYMALLANTELREKVFGF